MLTALILIIYSAIAIIVGYFATQNTSLVTLSVFSYTFKYVPVYLIILCSIFSGLVISVIAFTLKMISYNIQLNEKKRLLKEIKIKNAEIVKQVHQLELENTQLKTKYEVVETDDKSLT